MWIRPSGESAAEAVIGAAPRNGSTRPAAKAVARSIRVAAARRPPVGGDGRPKRRMGVLPGRCDTVEPAYARSQRREVRPVTPGVFACELGRVRSRARTCLLASSTCSLTGSERALTSSERALGAKDACGSISRAHSLAPPRAEPRRRACCHGYNPFMLKVFSRPTLRSPVLLCALSGWPDAGQAA